MKIATFNMENIFYRDEVLVKKRSSHSLSAWMEEFDTLMYKRPKIDEEYSRMRELSFLMGFQKPSHQPYVIMRRKAGGLYCRKRKGNGEARASDLTNWNGWIRINSWPIRETALMNKARLISEVNPDILLLQEVEDRQSLIEFNEAYLSEEVRFSQVSLQEGNDQHCRELGIMLKGNYSLQSVTSHSNERFNGSELFDKDLQEFEIRHESGRVLQVLVAHLAEEGTGHEEKRRDQFRRLAEVYRDLVKRGRDQVVVAGTFNVPSYHESASVLLRETDLKQIQRHRCFVAEIDENHPSLTTYGEGVNLKQRDYLLFSPELYSRVVSTGLNRRGIWPQGKNQVSSFKNMHNENDQASTHPLIWADLDG